MKSAFSTLALTVALLPSVSACAGGDDAQQVVVRDSAGVTIVGNVDVHGPPRWTTEAEPLLAIGMDDRSGFGSIAGVVRLEDGTLAVADVFTRAIRFFDETGEELGSVGRRGEGPGEFEAISGIWPRGPDSVGVWDSGLLRYTVVARDGGYAPPVRLQPTGERDRPTPIGTLPDGRLIAAIDSRQSPGVSPYRAEIAVALFDLDGAVSDTLFRVPGIERWDWEWEMGVTPSNVPFGRTTVFGFHEDALFVGANDAYQIDRHDLSGRLELRIRLDREAGPVSRDLIEAYKAEERAKAESGQASKGGNGVFGRMAEDAPYPEQLPHYDALLIDGGGNLWVRDFRGDRGMPARFTVFGREGHLVGTAEFPPEFSPVEIRDKEAVGIWRDMLGIEHVRLYRLQEAG